MRDPVHKHLSCLWPHAVRLVLGLVFIYAGYVKIIDPTGFAKNIYHYQLLPDLWINVSAWVLPWLEVVSGAALILVPPLRRGAAAWIFLLLLLFTGAILISLYRGLDISCGCLSTNPDAAKIGWRKVAENIGLLALAAWAFIKAKPASPTAI
jgi:uncharacterized membrane protein YphA (DoxX/SURF4 family)